MMQPMWVCYDVLLLFVTVFVVTTSAAAGDAQFLYRGMGNDAAVIELPESCGGAPVSPPPFLTAPATPNSIACLDAPAYAPAAPLRLLSKLQVGDKLKVMILSMDLDKGRVTLSTKKLEKEPGDMLRDPQLVFEGAEAMAESFRTRIANAEQGQYVSDDPDLMAAEQGFVTDPAAAPGQPIDPAAQQQYAFDVNP